jgi:hypothetical protein
MQESGDRRAPAASDAQEHEKTHEKAKKNARAQRAKRAFFSLLYRGEDFRWRRNSPEKIKKSELPKTNYAAVSVLISQPRNTLQACFPARAETQKASKSAPKATICFT